MGPEAWEPSPYWISNVPLCSCEVPDDEGLYECLDWQPVQLEEGTQRSEEPVSKSIMNSCAGVPIETVPVHSSSS